MRIAVNLCECDPNDQHHDRQSSNSHMSEASGSVFPRQRLGSCFCKKPAAMSTPDSPLEGTESYESVVAERDRYRDRAMLFEKALATLAAVADEEGAIYTHFYLCIVKKIIETHAAADEGTLLRELASCITRLDGLEIDLRRAVRVKEGHDECDSRLRASQLELDAVVTSAAKVKKEYEMHIRVMEEEEHNFEVSPRICLTRIPISGRLCAVSNRRAEYHEATGTPFCCLPFLSDPATAGGNIASYIVSADEHSEQMMANEDGARRERTCRKPSRR